MSSRIGQAAAGAVEAVRRSYRLPPQVAEILAVKRGLFSGVVLKVLIFTGEESPWVEPARTTIRTQRPPGWVQPRVGQRILVQPSGDQSPPMVLWDAPEPPQPRMTFPQIPGGDDPAVMRAHLEYLVQNRALTPAQFARAVASLEGDGSA